MLISINLNVDNGGTPITTFSLEVIDSAALSGVFTVVTNYDGVSSQYTLDVATDTFLVPGVIYDIRVRPLNLIGYGDYSTHLRQALVALPLAPLNLRRVETQCSNKVITVTWDQVQDGLSPGGIIRGYNLYMANDTAGSYQLVYNGTDRPLVRT